MEKPHQTYDIAEGDLHMAVLYDRVLERALRFRAFDSWATRDRSLDELVRLLDAEILFESRARDSETVVLDLPHAVLMLLLERRAEAVPVVYTHVHAGSRSGATLELARIKELLPPADEPKANAIKVGFWYEGPRGPRIVHRNVDALSWSEASHNYPGKTREALEKSMRDSRAVFAVGRLMLWHGAPGTGKTSALRTFALENRRSLSIEYVLDPEALFGRDAAYFIKVLFSENDDDGEEEEPSAVRSRILVLEDCDELMSADAKERSGQGLARLLNLVDGLIGQGLKVNVLITTNAALGGFHPAVSRPGRCGAVISFELFDAHEATEWLGRSGVDAPVGGSASLAELFALRDGRNAPEPRRSIGFVTSRESAEISN
jgi:SpoVK/Ycf46/Vps4 family AAA+-type ATPase